MGMRPSGARREEEERDAELSLDPDADLEAPDDAESTQGLLEAEMTLEKWIRKEIHGHEEIQGSVVIELAHVGTNLDKAIKRWRYRLDGPKGMAKDIVDCAEEAGETQHGKVRFVVKLITGGIASIKFALFRPQSPVNQGEVGQNDLAGDAEAFSVQQMDHNQVLVTRLLQGSDRNDNFLRQFIKDLQGQIKELTGERTHLMALTKELIQMKWLIEDQREEKKLSRERKEKFMQVALPIGLSMLLGQNGNRGAIAGMLGGMGGGPGGPGGPPPGMGGPPPGYPGGPPPDMGPSGGAAASEPSGIELQVAMLIDSITSDQMQRIATTDLFRPEQIVMLMQLNESLVKKRGARPTAQSSQTVEGVFDPASEVQKRHPGPDEPWMGGFELVVRPQ